MAAVVGSHGPLTNEPVDGLTLSDILAAVPASLTGEAPATVTGVAYRSDLVRPGDVFFCIRGFAHDGHDFAADAVSRGASALVVERKLDIGGVAQAIVPDARVALAEASAVAWGNPTRELDVVGVTGTNGKTTVTYLVDSIMRAAGWRTGLVGTVETRIGEDRLPAGRTTPESADLQALFAKMLREGCSGASVEVSSHAIDLHRVDGMRFAVAAFTNLSQDHLDYHHTMEEYFAVKKRLFTDMAVDERVVNVDDAYGAAIAAEVDGCRTVGMTADADVRARDVDSGPRGSTFTLVTPLGDASVSLPLAAQFNVSNALVAAGCGFALGLGLDDVVSGLEAAPQVPGRLERVEAGQPFSVLVDYAHTPDSLEKAIAAIKRVTPGRVITVFGCGGDRDPSKRPLMGRAAGLLSDVVIITSDNPRSEDPVGIILQAADGLRDMATTYATEIDRRAAIAAAIAQASPGDAVLIAGKGHEDRQQFSDRTIRFDDREVAREELGRLRIGGDGVFG